MNFNSRLLWVTGVSLAAFNLACGVAQAQNGVVSEEVVVTATGREAALQDVPLAVTALNASEIENTGATDLRALEQIAPSYRFFTGQSNTAGTTAYIRGIGTGGDNPGFESAVGFFIDGVYRNRSGVALADLPEVRRVEVLRGPQGTLFGRNTSAGAISVVTAGPEFEPSVRAQVTAGSRQLWDGDLTLTGPLGSDTVAGRLDISGRKQDGYIRDAISGRDINDKNRASARGQILAEFGDSGSVRVIGDYAKSDEECCVGITRIAGPTATVLNSMVSGAIQPFSLDDPRVAVSPGRSWAEGVIEYGASGQVDYDFGDVRFTSITAYRDWEATRNMDVDYSGVDRAYREGYNVSFQTFTQEARLQGVAGRLDWLLGAFYAAEKLDLTDRVRFGADAARYADNVIAANTGGGQLFGTSPYQLAQLGVVPGWRPNVFGLAFLQGPVSSGGTGNTGVTIVNGQPVPTALLVANATQRATYTNLANAFAAAAPVAGSGQQADRWRTDTDSLALFTHNQLNLTDALMLTVGLRYNYEEKLLTGDLNSVQPACDTMRSPTIAPVASAIVAANPAALALLTIGCNPAVNTLQNGAYADKVTDKEWTGVASLSAKLTPDALLYASYSRGYKAGGFNLDRSSFSVLPTTLVRRTSDDLQFDPEFVDAYEMGLKVTIGSIGNFNATAFYQEITDYQLNEFAGFNFQTRNIPEAVSKGLELETTLRPFTGLTVNGGAVYNEAYFDSPVVFPNETLPAGTVMRQAPKYSVTGSAAYEFPLSDALEGLVYLDARWNSEYRTQTLNRNPATDNDAYTLVNARVGVAHDNGWGLEVFAQNLTDQTYYIGGFNPPEQPGTWGVYPGLPRTFGVTLKAEF